MWRRIIGIDDNKEEESIERIITPPPLQEATDEQLNQERERYRRNQQEDEGRKRIAEEYFLTLNPRHWSKYGISGTYPIPIEYPIDRG